MRESLRVIVGKEVERGVDIGMAKDGSGVGGGYCNSCYTFYAGKYLFTLLPAALCALQAIKQL
jgi:hypothetical protein